MFRGGVGTIFPAERLNVVSSSTPLVLFEAARDTGRLAFTRIGDAGRRGIFRIDHLSTGATVFHFELPIANGRSPTDYTASLVIKDRIRARQETITAAKAVRVRLRGLQTRQILHVTLMEDDGTSWTAAVVADSTWNEQSVPLSRFAIGRGVSLPEGFPGEWNYWVPPAINRAGVGDIPRLDHVERLQLSLRRGEGHGVEVEWIALGF